MVLGETAGVAAYASTDGVVGTLPDAEQCDHGNRRRYVEEVFMRIVVSTPRNWLYVSTLRPACDRYNHCGACMLEVLYGTPTSAATFRGIAISLAYADNYAGTQLRWRGYDKGAVGCVETIVQAAIEDMLLYNEQLTSVSGYTSMFDRWEWSDGDCQPSTRPIPWSWELRPVLDERLWDAYANRNR